MKSIASHQKAPDASVSAKIGAAYAAVDSKKEIPGRAAAKKTDDFHDVVENQQTEEPFNREAFVQALFDKINVTAPKSLGDVADFDKNNNLDSVKQDLHSGVEKGKQESQGQLPDELRQSPRPEDVQRDNPQELPRPQAGATPQITAAGAAPKAATDEQISLQSGPQAIDQQMANSDVTEDQLRDSNEPDFNDALEQKKQVEQAAVSAPLVYRAQEPGLLQSAEIESQHLAGQQVLGMHGIRQNRFGAVMGSQTKAKTEEQKQRDSIYATVEGFYVLTKTGVEARLCKLDKDVDQRFSVGAKVFQDAFQEDVDADVSAYKAERYDGLLRGSYRWWRDKIKGMPDAVNRFYEKRLKEYQDSMRRLLYSIADMIVTGLNDARNIIAAGKKAIDAYIATLKPQWQATGKKAAGEIEQKFDSLDESVKDKRDQLIDSLAGKYNENLQQVNARIEKMKEENRGLVDKVVGAIKGVIQTIMHLKDMLLNVLSRAAAAIGLIIAHPIRFLGNLVDAGKLGFNNFKDHIVDHLKEGFMEWLFGKVAETGIQLPKVFDLQGILDLVLQVLGLTRANIRKRAVDILGEKVVSAIEGTAEIFKVLVTEGPGGLLKYLEGKLDDTIGMVIDKVKTFVMERILIAGVKWLIGLLNPASAFVKACMAIYDIIMFFVDHGSQILDLVNTIIDSITDIASGAIGKAAAAVEQSLARAIPIMIGFLASLLGVGGISEKIQEILETIRRPINNAIDWVINKAASLGKGIVGGVRKVAGKIFKLVFPQETFRVGSEDHRIEAKEGTEDYHIVIHSKEMTIEDFIEAVKAERPKDALALQKAFTAYHSVKVDSKELDTDKRQQDLEQKGKIKIEKYEAVASLIAIIYPKIPSLSGQQFQTKIIYGPTDQRGGSLMVAHPLAADNIGEGSAPDQSSDFPPIWPSITKKRQGDDTRLYIKGHLLNKNLGGRGEKLENITPLTYSANRNHNVQVEEPLKELVTKRNKKMAHYEVHVNYPASKAKVPSNVNADEGLLATSLTARWYELVPQGNKLEQTGPTKTETIQNVPPYPHS
ncbi:MAG TPA: DNA/RNA non-specific endonuclease [Terracidiphilus sp.]